MIPTTWSLAKDENNAGVCQTTFKMDGSCTLWWRYVIANPQIYYIICVKHARLYIIIIHFKERMHIEKCDSVLFLLRSKEVTLGEKKQRVPCWTLILQYYNVLAQKKELNLTACLRQTFPSVFFFSFPLFFFTRQFNIYTIPSIMKVRSSLSWGFNLPTSLLEACPKAYCTIYKGSALVMSNPPKCIPSVRGPSDEMLKISSPRKMFIWIFCSQPR